MLRSLYQMAALAATLQSSYPTGLLVVTVTKENLVYPVLFSWLKSKVKFPKGKQLICYNMIAAKICISYAAVNSHISKIYKKLLVNSGTEAVAKAIEQKLVWDNCMLNCFYALAAYAYSIAVQLKI